MSNTHRDFVSNESASFSNGTSTTKQSLNANNTFTTHIDHLHDTSNHVEHRPDVLIKARTLSTSKNYNDGSVSNIGSQNGHSSPGNHVNHSHIGQNSIEHERKVNAFEQSRYNANYGYNSNINDGVHYETPPYTSHHYIHHNNSNAYLDSTYSTTDVSNQIYDYNSSGDSNTGGIYSSPAHYVNTNSAYNTSMPYPNGNHSTANSNNPRTFNNHYTTGDSQSPEGRFVLQQTTKDGVIGEYMNPNAGLDRSYIYNNSIESNNVAHGYSSTSNPVFPMHSTPTIVNQNEATVSYSSTANSALAPTSQPTTRSRDTVAEVSNTSQTNLDLEPIDSAEGATQENKQPNLESVSTQNLPSGATLSHYRLQQPSSFQFTCFTETDMKQLYGGEKQTTRRKLMKQKRMEVELKTTQEGKGDNDSTPEDKDKTISNISESKSPQETNQINEEIEEKSTSEETVNNNSFETTLYLANSCPKEEYNTSPIKDISNSQPTVVEDQASSQMKVSNPSSDLPRGTTSQSHSSPFISHVPSQSTKYSNSELYNLVPTPGNAQDDSQTTDIQMNYKFPPGPSVPNTYSSQVLPPHPIYYSRGNIQPRKRSYDHTMFQKYQTPLGMNDNYNNYYANTQSTPNTSWQRSKSVPNLDEDEANYFKDFYQNTSTGPSEYNYYSSHPSSTNSSPRGMSSMYDRRLRRRVSLTEDITPSVENDHYFSRRNSADVSHLFYPKGYMTNIRRASMPNTHANIHSGHLQDGNFQSFKEQRRSSVSSLIGPGFRGISLDENSASKSHEEWFRKYKQHEVDENLQNALASFKFGASTETVENLGELNENEPLEENVQTELNSISYSEYQFDTSNQQSAMPPRRRRYNDTSQYLEANSEDVNSSFGHNSTEYQFDSKDAEYAQHQHVLQLQPHYSTQTTYSDLSGYSMSHYEIPAHSQSAQSTPTVNSTSPTELKPLPGFSEIYSSVSK